MSVRRVDSPVGPLFVSAQDGVVTAVSWHGAATVDGAPGAGSVLNDAARQLDAYFAGQLREFDVPMSVAGSDFLRAVCAQIEAIPFGETRTYGDIARALGVPAQAVGQACGGNPIPILIPCHRVLGATSLGGYSGDGGIETKVALLRHEGAAGLLI